MSHEEWLQARQQGIGGSDASVVAGLNPYKSRVQLYLEKTGEVDAPDLSNNEKVYWGNVLEDVVAKEFMNRTELKVRRRNSILTHPVHNFMLANVDRLIIGAEEGLECKTASSYMQEHWKDGKIPEMYICQIQQYMAVTGYKAWWIAVLIGGSDFRFQKVERDDEFINLLIQLESDFWINHVQAGVMPEVDGSQSTTAIINKMFPESNQEQITLPDDTPDLIRDYFEYCELEKRYAELKDESANKIKMLLGENERGLTNGYMVNWKPVKSNRFDSKAFQKAQPELYQKYINESVSRRFSIKPTQE
jgi:putative phage-type endonuclease